MPPFLVQQAAALRIDEIYRYTQKEWGRSQADAYINGLFDAFAKVGTLGVFSRPIPAEFELDGFYFKYGKHFVYWRHLTDGHIGIVTILHERMHQIERFQGVFEL